MFLGNNKYSVKSDSLVISYPDVNG